RDRGITRGPEPRLQLRNQGQILGPDGPRMSQSRGNVVAPDEQVAAYGADTVRAYLMFGYRWAEGGPWSPANIQGVVRWLHRVWALATGTQDSSAPADPETARGLRRKVHQTVRQVSRDLDGFEFNTVVSGLMELTNAIAAAQKSGAGAGTRDSIRTLLLLMAPVTPHLAEELWSRMGLPCSIHNQAWPVFDPALASEDEITLVVQVNGKVRDRIIVPAGIGDDEARRRALESEAVRRQLAGQAPRKVIVVPGRLVNIVV
ncbi:MAG: class I tRNA ligase family protein, partial [Actinobacteria bacterium]|nr:class I tRNA ligase family protein [Actinomycetota bacterium]